MKYYRWKDCFNSWKTRKKTNPERIKDKEELEWKIKKLLPEYTEDTWYERFLKLADSKDEDKKKILIISDFINKAWWIETYIHDVKNLLESHWHEVILWGSTLPAWSKWQRKKRFWLLLSPFNFWNVNSLNEVLKNEKPDIIWFNSFWISFIR